MLVHEPTAVQLVKRDDSCVCGVLTREIRKGHVWNYATGISFKTSKFDTFADCYSKTCS